MFVVLAKPFFVFFCFVFFAGRRFFALSFLRGGPSPCVVVFVGELGVFT